jgi:hypothetical protein
MQHAQLQQVEVGPAVHLSLDHFEPVDLSFELAIVAGERQSCLHCIMIFLHALSEAAQRRDATLCGCGERLDPDARLVAGAPA